MLIFNAITGLIHTQFHTRTTLPWLLAVNFDMLCYFIFTDDIERTTSVEPQEPTTEDPPAARESEEEEAQSQRSPSPSEDVQQEEAGAQGQQQKEEESN